MNESLELAERVELAIRIGESHFREFKSALHGSSGQKAPKAPAELMTHTARTLVAFANADGGELLIGVEDDGAVTGVPHNDQTIEAILNAPVTHVHPETPLPGTRKAVIEIQEQKVIYFYVAKGTIFVHLTSDGRCLKRIDRESVPVSAEQVQGQRVEDSSRSYDRAFNPSARLQDLDLDLVQSVAAQVAYGISAEKCLQYLDLAEFTPNGLMLKNAALLLFAKDIRNWHPRCQVRITSYKGLVAQSGMEFNVLKDDTVRQHPISGRHGMGTPTGSHQQTDGAWRERQVRTDFSLSSDSLQRGPC